MFFASVEGFKKQFLSEKYIFFPFVLTFSAGGLTGAGVGSFKRENTALTQVK